MKLDKKVIAIIVLSIVLVWAIFVRTAKPIYKYEDEIDDLQSKNKLYLEQIKLLKKDSKLIDIEIEKLFIENQELQLKNKELDSTINHLTNAKTIIHTRTKLLNADSVVSEFSNYIQTKGL
jgi:CRISPR/Cas system CMR subunit Cmr4 (Cas7 group RAMP superfamily)